MQGAEASGEARLVGWRISEHVGALSSSLQELVTRVVTGAECGADMVCTEEDSSCQGDVGAPLTQVRSFSFMSVINNIDTGDILLTFQTDSIIPGEMSFFRASDLLESCRDIRSLQNLQIMVNSQI